MQREVILSSKVIIRVSLWFSSKIILVKPTFLYFLSKCCQIRLWYYYVTYLPASSNEWYQNPMKRMKSLVYANEQACLVDLTRCIKCATTVSYLMDYCLILTQYKRSRHKWTFVFLYKIYIIIVVNRRTDFYYRC